MRRGEGAGEPKGDGGVVGVAGRGEGNGVVGPGEGIGEGG